VSSDESGGTEGRDDLFTFPVIYQHLDEAIMSYFENLQSIRFAVHPCKICLRAYIVGMIQLDSCCLRLYEMRRRHGSDPSTRIERMKAKPQIHVSSWKGVQIKQDWYPPSSSIRNFPTKSATSLAAQTNQRHTHRIQYTPASK
jgi:hypothetical protein